MAGVVRDILDAQAPGVFFGEGAKGISYAKVYKEGVLEKLGRGRGLISAFMGKKWAERRFKLSEDYRMQYWDADLLRGEFPVDKAIVKLIPKEEADGKEYAFEITTKENEKIMLNATCETERRDWMVAIKDVSSGKFKLTILLDLLANYLQYPEGTKILIDIDEEALKRVMNTDGYAADRMIEIVQEYLTNFNQHVVRYVAEDAEFCNLFKQKFDTQTIKVVPAPDSDTSNGNYRTKFANGAVEIQFIKAWTNVNYCGSDLTTSISAGERIPYLVMKSIRQRKPVLDAYLQSIEQMLKISGVTYDWCINENLPAMRKANYGDNRFAEIFLDEHFKPLVQNMAKFIGQDPQFADSFVSRFATKKIVIKPAANPNAVKNYYDSSFSPEGDLVIVYRAVWTNINCLGQDFESILTDSSGLSYETTKSIRAAMPKMQAYLSAMETLLGVTGITYDYCVDVNLPALEKAGYDDSRFGEVYLDVYLKNLYEKLASFVAKDPNFPAAFNAKFTSRKLIIRIASNPDSLKNYHVSSFTPNGDFLVEYRAVWTNISCIGNDIPDILSEGGLSYEASKSIRDATPKMQAYLSAMEALLGVTGITYDYCTNVNLPAMEKAGYDDSRFGEVYLDVYLKNLYEKLVSFVAKDPNFPAAFNAKFTSRKLIIRIASNPDSLKNYHVSSFTPNGDFLVEYRAVWTNISYIGNDIPEILSEGGLSYEASKSIRDATPKMQAHLSQLEGILGVTGITYDYCVAENLPAMLNASYGEDRFGEIYLDEHLKNLVENVKRFADEDVQFAAAFANQFTSRKIIIKISSDPDTVKNYYDSSFTAEGDLLILYRAVWCNISYLGRDLNEILTEGGIPYTVSRSIRSHIPKMQAHLATIESLLGVSGVTYDYCIAENLPAMVKADYGQDRFGEIYLDEHLKNLVENLERFVNEDPQFPSFFNNKFTSRKIIIKISSDPDSVSNYYDSSFTAEGDLLIQYRAVWCNISYLGRDLTEKL